MAEVLSPLTQQNDPTSIFQSRSTSTDTFQVAMSASPRQSRTLQIPRSQFSSHGNNSGYRGASANHTGPQMSKSSPQLRQENRVASAPIKRGMRYPAPDSISSISSISSDQHADTNVPYSKDDALLFTNYQAPVFRNDSETADVVTLPPSLTIQRPASPAPKPSPERQRRGHRRGESSVASAQSDASVGSLAISTATVGQIFHKPQPVSLPSPLEKPVQPTAIDISSKQRRRSSVKNQDGKLKAVPGSPPTTTQKIPTTGAFVQNSNQYEATLPRPGSSSGMNRSFVSADAVRRHNNSISQSRPMTAESQQSSVVSMTPAVAAMAALNEKEAGKGVKSRLRRAFSFGSAQELRQASAEPDAVERARQRQEQFSQQLNGEREQTSQRQETGSGHNFYNSSAFTASTDNLSISSTASSASMMLRKMGNGVKKGGRSLKGLFRPKSVVGVPSIDAPLHASVGPVSLVNVEAEREQVNVNADPHEKAGGGTGFPRLENNSMDLARQSTSSMDGGQIQPPAERRPSESKRSMAGGEQDRTEVLSAVKRGILKRSAQSIPLPSPVTAPADAEVYEPGYGSPLHRQHSPVPSLVNSERRHDSSSLDNNDYFTSIAPKYTGKRTSKSLPGTPRSITFSPRVQFFDVWSPSDYDRKGDIATCNRLTPLLAQQIKEELNNFKMEMEVHAESKTYTHFF